MVDGLPNAYKIGDANLDGIVDGLDFIEWNDNKFTTSTAWSDGDFNGDGNVDGQDFIAWNNNKFTASDFSAVPEPTTTVTTLLLVALTAVLRQRSTSRSNTTRLG